MIVTFFTLTALSFLFTSFLFIGIKDEDKRIQAAADTLRDPIINISPQEAARRFGVNVAAVQDRVRFIERAPREFNVGRGIEIQKARAQAKRNVKQLRPGVFQIKSNGRTRVIRGSKAIAQAGFRVDSRGNLEPVQQATRQKIITSLLTRQGFNVSRDNKENIIARKGDRRLIISPNDKIFNVPRSAKVTPQIFLKRDIEKRLAEPTKVRTISPKPKKPSLIPTKKAKVKPKPLTKTQKLALAIKASKKRERESAERLARVPEAFKIFPELRGEGFVAKARRTALSIPFFATVGLGEALGLVADKSVLTFQALSNKETRRDTIIQLKDAFIKTPGEVKKQLNPKDPEGFVNLMFLLLAPGLALFKLKSIVPKPKGAKTSGKGSIKATGTALETQNKGSYTSTTGKKINYQINTRIPLKPRQKGKYSITLRDNAGKVLIKKIGNTVFEIRTKKGITKKILEKREARIMATAKKKALRKKERIEEKRKKARAKKEKEGLKGVKKVIKRVKKEKIATKRFKKRQEIARLLEKSPRGKELARLIKTKEDKIFLKQLKKSVKRGKKVDNKKRNKLIRKVKLKFKNLNTALKKRSVDFEVFLKKIERVPIDFSEAINFRIGRNVDVINKIVKDLGVSNKVLLAPARAKIIKSLKPLIQDLGKIGLKLQITKIKALDVRINAVGSIKKAIRNVKLKAKAVNVRLVFTKGRVKASKKIITERTLLEITSRINRAVLRPTANTLANVNLALKKFNLRLEIQRVKFVKRIAEKAVPKRSKLVRLFAKGVSKVSPFNVKVRTLNVRNKQLSKRVSQLIKDLRKLERKQVKTKKDQARIRFLNRKQKQTVVQVSNVIKKKIPDVDARAQFEKLVLRRKIQFLDDVLSGRTKINILFSVTKKAEPKTTGFPSQLAQSKARLKQLTEQSKDLKRAVESGGQSQKSVQLLVQKTKTVLKRKTTRKQRQLILARLKAKRATVRNEIKTLSKVESISKSVVKTKVKGKSAVKLIKRIKPIIIAAQVTRTSLTEAIRQLDKITQIIVQRQEQPARQVQKQRVGPKLTQKQLQDQISKQKQKQKQKAATARVLKRLLKARKIPKRIPPPILLELEKVLKKRRLLVKRKNTKFIFRADLFSRIENLKASPNEKKKLLKIGRIFFGTELRKRVR